MTRSFGSLDVIVAIGLGATVLGGGVLFLAANGTLPIPTVEARPVEPPMNSVSETGLLQPVIGRAIVERSFIETQAAESIPAAGAKLNQAVLADQRLQQSARGYAASIETSAQQVEAEHAGRIQAVMGRSIVNFTQRGVRNGLLSAALPFSAYHHRMIRMTDAMGKRMDGEFIAHRQPNLGRAIVAATHDVAIVAVRTQERMGHAIVQMTKTRAAYEEARSVNQDQLGSVVVAAVRAELRSGHLGRPAGGELLAEPTRAATGPEAWPEIPLGYLVAGSVGLIGLFIAGLFLAPWRREEEIVIEESMPGVVTRVYRRAV